MSRFSLRDIGLSIKLSGIQNIIEYQRITDIRIYCLFVRLFVWHSYVYSMKQKFFAEQYERELCVCILDMHSMQIIYKVYLFASIWLISVKISIQESILSANWYITILKMPSFENENMRRVVNSFPFLHQLFYIHATQDSKGFENITSYSVTYSSP